MVTRDWMDSQEKMEPKVPRDIEDRREREVLQEAM